MKYLLVDKFDNIVSSVVLDSSVGITGARTYFLGIKRIEEEKFKKLWKVMSEEDYDEKYKSHTRNPSSSEYKWWKEENTNLDDF